MLHLDRLHLTQGDFALSADWRVGVGERIALIGPSGAGKSSLLLAIAGFLAPTKGQIRWNGQDLATQAAGARPMTILFQDQNLFPHLTLQQNLGLGVNPTLRLTAQEVEQIESVQNRVGLAGLGAAKPAQLSGGQQGRAALARALLRARPILLLDEPFAALGPAMKAEMLELLAELTAESPTLVLMVTHDPTDAKRFANKVSLVADGVAAAPVQTDALFNAPPAALLAYLGNP